MGIQQSLTKTPFDNVKMLHPDGTIMCYTSLKRANNFIGRELAQWKVIDKEFQLLFTPAGYGKSDSPYYMQEHKNCCVVCGTDTNLNKHHVFPHVFRKHMPIVYKSYSSHDVLPICVECHDSYERHGNVLKYEIAFKLLGTTKLNSPTEEQKINRLIIRSRQILSFLNESNQYVKNNKLITLPEHVVQKYQKQASMELLTDNVEHWSKQIMDIIFEKNELQQFIEMWRQHFLDITQPKYMPKFWSVHKPLEKASKIRNGVKLNEQDYKMLKSQQTQ